MVTRGEMGGRDKLEDWDQHIYSVCVYVWVESAMSNF